MAEALQLTSINQQDTVKLSTFPEFPFYQLKSCSFCVDVKLTARPYSEKEDARAPLDLVAVIDRSGSMIGQKLDLVKKVLHFVVSHLKHFDRLGIVVYDNVVEEIAGLTKVTQTNRIHLDAKIDKIYGDGSTNLSGGLMKGMSVMKGRSAEQADVASVLLFTDGIANFGMTDTSDIVTAMNNVYGSVKNFTVNTFGFGGDHNVNMLKQISQTGNGLYYFIQNTEQIPEIFTNCLGGLLSTVAQNISICIETCNGAIVQKIHSKEKPSLSDGNMKGEVSMGDLQSEEEHDILVELTLPGIESSCSCTTSYARIILTYFNVIKKNNDSVATEVSVSRCLEPGEQTPSLEVDEQRNRIKAIEALAEATEMAEKGKLEKARSIISYSQQRIQKSPFQGSGKIQSLTKDLSSAMEGISDEREYRNSGRSIFSTLGDSHLSQRSTSLESPSYVTTSRRSTYDGYVKQSEESHPQSKQPHPPTHSKFKRNNYTQPLSPGLLLRQNSPTSLESKEDTPPAIPERNRSKSKTFTSTGIKNNEDSPPVIPSRSHSRRQTLKSKDASKGPPFISEL